jgi:hypothetical protein
MGQGGYPKNRESRYASTELKIGCGRFGLNAALGTDVVLIGSGTAASPTEDATASPKFMSFYVKSSAATGTARGNYTRLYLSGGAGGEAGRFYTTVSSNTPADTVNGVHCSLDFGASAGNVTGLGTAGRFTLQVPGRSLGGSTAAVQAELFLDTSAALGGNCSFIRMVADGAGKAAVDTSGYLFSIQGLTANTDKLFRVATPGSAAASLRCLIGGTPYYLLLATAPA